MWKTAAAIVALFTLVVLLFFIYPAVMAQVSPSGEAVPPISAEAKAAPSGEATGLVSAEVKTVSSGEASAEVKVATSGEAGTMASGEAAKVAAPPPKPLEEGSGYKGVPWGADLNKFMEVKNVFAEQGELSAAFIGNEDDNDIALIIGTPISEKKSGKAQRVMFEKVPQKFSAVYLEPEDVNYIFYDGSFAMAFSKIDVTNFDYYRDHMYKKYKKAADFSVQFIPAPNKKYKLDAIRFKKGEMDAFLMKRTITEKKKIAVSAALLFVNDQLLSDIQDEIKGKRPKGMEPITEKSKQALEKDLKKIE
jgi:hypothetical protein